MKCNYNCQQGKSCTCEQRVDGISVSIALTIVALVVLVALVISPFIASLIHP